MGMSDEDQTLVEGEINVLPSGNVVICAPTATSFGEAPPPAGGDE